MDQINEVSNYRQLVKQAMRDYKTSFLRGCHKPLPYEISLIFDDEHQHYLVRTLGWQKSDRIDRIAMHVVIRNGKIWIEEDWTEDGVATYFLNHGVPNDQIVLGFQAPYMRPYTEFAVE